MIPDTIHAEVTIEMGMTQIVPHGVIIAWCIHVHMCCKVMLHIYIILCYMYTCVVCVCVGKVMLHVCVCRGHTKAVSQVQCM